MENTIDKTKEKENNMNDLFLNENENYIDGWFNGYAEDFLHDLLEMKTSTHKFIKSAKKLIRELTEKIANDPQNYKLYTMRGIFYDKLNRKDRARDDFKKALSLNKKNTYFYCGFLLNGIPKQEQECIKFLTEAINLDENFSFAYLLRGHAHYKVGQYEQAIYDYNKFNDLDPTMGNAVVFFERGCCLFSLACNASATGNKIDALNMMALALIEFNTAVYTEPGSCDRIIEAARNNRMVAAAKIGRLQQALYTN